jgi:uncharacterized membrane protein HdeD (DUF308 family)
MDSLLNRGVHFLRTCWQLLALTGAASVVLGILAIAASFTATLATVVFLGCLIFAGGLVHFIQSLSIRGWTGFFGHSLATVLYGVVGWYMIMHPAASAASLTLLIGVLLMVGGLYQIVTSVALLYKSWGWALLNGIVSGLLGVFIFRQWPASALWVIGTFVGIDLVLRGWATLMLALAARGAIKTELEHINVQDRRIGLHDRRAVAA